MQRLRYQADRAEPLARQDGGAASLTVGLTGNVASGKTTVAQRWRESGVTVIDADRLGHEILEEDVPSGEALAAELTRFLRNRDRENGEPDFASDQ